MWLRDKEAVAAGYETLIGRFVAIARADDNIRAALVIGSRARTDHPADEWADLDVIVFAREPARLLDDTSWLRHIGPFVLTFVEETAGGGDRERRVLFANGSDVDFAVLPLSHIARFRAALKDGRSGDEIVTGAATAFGRGYRTLLDKDGLTAGLEVLTAAPLPGPTPPTPAAFDNDVNDFFYHVVWTARHLRRGERWWALGGCGHLRVLLLRMLEWHARATRGGGYDTWFRGRFLEEWADPRAVASFRSAFPRYEDGEIAATLAALLDLYARFARETAEASGFMYAAAGENYTSRLLTDVLAP